MTGRDATDDRGAAIDSRLDAILESASTATLAPARTAVTAFDDQWYGQLVGRSADALAPESSNASTVERLREPAAAVELLRGYCALRCAVLCEDVADPTGLATASRSGPGLTAPLLSGDFLFAAAYATLDEAARSCDDHGRSERAFDVLTRTTSTILETVGETGVRPESPSQYVSLVDGVAGTLGACAARLGASLTPTDRRIADSAATVGRAASASRQLRFVLNASSGPKPVAPFPTVAALPNPHAAVDALRRHAERRRETAREAIASLPADADRVVLRPLVDGEA